MPFTLFGKKDAAGKETAKVAQPVPLAPTPAPIVLMMDFDAVISDSREQLYAILNKMSQDKRLGLSIKSYKDVKDIRKNTKLLDMGKLFTSRQEIANLLLNGLAEKIAETKLYQGIKEFATTMREAGFIIGIVCTNRASTVESFLQLHGMNNVFHFIKGAAAADKTDLLYAVVKEYKAKKESTYYITGCVEHMSIAKKIAQVVGVTWGGYDTQADLTSEKPSSVVQRPAELIELLTRKHPHALPVEKPLPLMIESAPANVTASAAATAPNSVVLAVQPETVTATVPDPAASSGPSMSPR